jgi:hypothetical protein
MKKQRKLTDKQLKLLTELQSGASYYSAGKSIGVCEGTARAKHKAILDGARKNAYSNLPDSNKNLPDSNQSSNELF